MIRKLVVAYLAPTALLVALLGSYSYYLARRALERELGARLVAIARVGATQLDEQLLANLAPGDDGTRTAMAVRRRLLHLVQATDAARAFVIDVARKSLGDSQEGVPIGHEYLALALDDSELQLVLSQRRAISSVLFTSQRGVMLKRGYAPVAEPDGHRPRFVLVVEGSAEYFADLGSLTGSLFAFGAGAAVLVVAVSILVARRLTRPVRRLVEAARQIGQGKLDVPIEAESRDEIGFLATTMNEMRSDLQARDERMRMMLAGIAHEVRNPLGGIELFVGLLAEELVEAPEPLDYTRRISRELGHLQRVVTDFLDYARRPRLERTEVNIDRLLTEVQELARTDAEKRTIAVTVHVDGDRDAGRGDSVAGDHGDMPPDTAGEQSARERRAATSARAIWSVDPTQLRRALLNLLSNALQATPASGSVELRATTDKQPGILWGVIEVRDTGVGIPPELREKIFNPFFTTKEKGMGLGLAFVREIVEEHGGKLEVESRTGTTPPSGTTIRIRLPLPQP